MPTAITIKDIDIDLRAHRVRRAGGEVPLTPQEYALLEALAVNRGHPLTRSALLEQAWGWALAAENATRTVDVHIQKLRRKLGLSQEIQTVYKVGYLLS